jgi:hypothetical protein
MELVTSVQVSPIIKSHVCNGFGGHHVFFIFCFLSVFENRFLRKIFGHNRDDVTGGWRKLRNEELHNLFSSPDIIG